MFALENVFWFGGGGDLVDAAWHNDHDRYSMIESNILDSY